MFRACTLGSPHYCTVNKSLVTHLWAETARTVCCCILHKYGVFCRGILQPVRAVFIFAAYVCILRCLAVIQVVLEQEGSRVLTHGEVVVAWSRQQRRSEWCQLKPSALATLPQLPTNIHVHFVPGNYELLSMSGMQQWHYQTGCPLDHLRPPSPEQTDGG